MAFASDTALGEKLTRDKSVTEPWITSPRNDDNKKGKSVQEKIPNEKSEPSNLSNNEDKSSKPFNETVKNKSSKNEPGNDDTKQSSLVMEKPEPEIQSAENNSVKENAKPQGNNEEIKLEPKLQSTENSSVNENAKPQGNNEEVKPTIIGNVIEQKSHSAKSNGNADDEPINDDDLDMYDPELFITEEERKAFDYMIDQRKEEIENDKVKFEKWVDALTRRRMFALSRLRKLGKSHGERFKLYGKVQDYVREVESVLSSVSSSAKSVHSENSDQTVQSRKLPSASSTTTKHTSRQVPEAKDLQREITGFVNAQEDDKGFDSSGSNAMNNNDLTKDESPKIVPVQS